MAFATNGFRHCTLQTTTDTRSCNRGGVHTRSCNRGGVRASSDCAAAGFSRGAAGRSGDVVSTSRWGGPLAAPHPQHASRPSAMMAAALGTAQCVHAGPHRRKGAFSQTPTNLQTTQQNSHQQLRGQLPPHELRHGPLCVTTPPPPAAAPAAGAVWQCARLRRAVPPRAGRPVAIVLLREGPPNPPGWFQAAGASSAPGELGA
jgi:hypothetical protein